ncbi:MAG: hypothetical protein GF365_05655 [Candidatus Buchananbacteria bacterium]|nr:hypothetical protein [Candidatus Buchananbacteria bacterium]
MSTKNIIIIGLILLIVLLGFGFLAVIFSPEITQDQTVTKKNNNDPAAEKKQPESEKQAQPKAESMMILIEFKDTVGLSNFVNEMEQRDIHGLLMVTPEFVQDNCDDIKEVIKHNVEIVGTNVEEPFWDVPYEDQKERILEIKQGIESCTNVPVRIISSRYMASDTTTLKVANELGIPYITARGTTDTKATVYAIENYDTKILSVSNIPIVTFKYGSLCDYSFFERAGEPEDMRAELDRAYQPLSDKEKARYGAYHKVTPVSHTWIGGYLEPWQNMWQDFWDNKKEQIEWVTLDELMAEPDWTLPLWQLPINKNAPYTPEKIRPLIPYEKEEKVQNPCAVQDIGKAGQEQESADTSAVDNKILMFHNGTGPMCLDAMEFVEDINYPVEQVLNDEENFRQRFNEIKNKFEQSQGVSDSFGYYPIIFVNDKAFSGFNEQIKNQILSEIGQ